MCGFVARLSSCESKKVVTLFKLFVCGESLKKNQFPLAYLALFISSTSHHQRAVLFIANSNDRRYISFFFNLNQILKTVSHEMPTQQDEKNVGV